jgi:hypothetical protein
MTAHRLRTRVAGLLLLAAGIAAAAPPLTIIELQHRLPAELIPQLAPLAGPDGVVTGANNLLLVRASPARLADIRRALDVLDRPARNLLVEVRSLLDRQAQRRGAVVGVDEPVGEHGRVVIGRGGTGIGVRAEQRAARQDVLQRVRVIDGGSARIDLGTTTPVPVRERWRTPGGDWQRDGIAVVETGSGFRVTPRVQGDRVVVDIEQQNAVLDGRQVRGGGVQTQVSGPLGAWLPLGGTDAAGRRAMGGIGGGGQETTGDISELELRVTVLD